MKISFITTVFNEEQTIEKLLESLDRQSVLPDEIIIVDGGSSDETVAKIQNSKFKIQNYSSKFKILEKLGNRSVGRNEAIKKATGDIIVCTDAGCILDKDWIKNITKSFKDIKVDVVAGYYSAKPNSVFEKCLVPYVLVMPDRVDSNNFLPATRSMAFRKSVWEKVGGFNEHYSHNEDYVFARTLKKINAKIVFAKDAIVYWIPRSTIKESFIMFFRFAYGDAQARIFRPKVLLIFLRYILGIGLIVFSLIFQSIMLFTILCLLLLFYFLWAITKSYRYVKHWQAIFILPLLQIISDIAVLTGTTIGAIKKA